MANQLNTYNALPACLRESLRLSSLIFSQDAATRAILGAYASKACALHSISALHSFLNNLLEASDLPAAGRLSDKVGALLTARNKTALQSNERLLFNELEQVEDTILNPTIVRPFKLGGLQDGMIDFERTTLFKMVRNSDNFDPLYSLICAGIVCLLLSRLTIVHLELKPFQIIRTFGITLQTDDGFQDVLVPTLIKLILDYLKELRDSGLLNRVTEKGVQKEWYALDFLEPYAV